MNYREIARQIFLAGVEEVLPSRLISKHVTLNKEKLVIGHLKFDLDDKKKVYVVGAGKASALMASEIEKLIGKYITEGQIVVKYGHGCQLNSIKVTEAGHPLPDMNGYYATKEIVRIVTQACENDLIICLLSGGGSALLHDFPEGVSHPDILITNNLLINSGATIHEINTVRKHLSHVKGGQLALAAYPATMVSLILSDVIGDSLDVIASGPTVPDSSTFQQALSVLAKYQLIPIIPKSVIDYLKQGVNGLINETLKLVDFKIDKIHNFLIGTNRIALQAAKEKGQEYNFEVTIMDNPMQGDVSTIAESIASFAVRIKNDKDRKKTICLLYGGETTIKMTGNGKGGRNQHFALYCSYLLQNHSGITILSAGTDGTDGPTNVAGAVVDSTTYDKAMHEKVDPLLYIHEFNSYHFFEKFGGHILTGPTKTNVMDMVVVIIN